MTIHECSDCEAAIIQENGQHDFLGDSGWRRVLVRVCDNLASSADPYFLLCDECYAKRLGDL